MAVMAGLLRHRLCRRDGLPVHTAEREYLERMMRNRLSELTADARTAVDRARQLQQQGAAAVGGELARLYALATEINELRRPL